MRASIGIFVKEPRPGRVKTRLARSLGDAAAAGLYAAFVADTVTLALKSPARHCRIFHDGADPSAWLDGWSSAAGRSARLQATGGLGERLVSAFADGPCPLLVLGSDSPDLPAGHVHAALRALDQGAEVVLGPVADGGVWCIGLDRPRPGLFDGVPWSSARTGEALRNRADALGLNRTECAAWYDCDDEDDLRALRVRLRTPDDVATMTRRALELLDPANEADRQ